MTSSLDSSKLLSQEHLIDSEASRLQADAPQHVIGFLCRAWGETDLPEAALVRTREEIIAFIIAAQFGDTPLTDLHEENRQIIKEQIAAMDLDVASCDAAWQIDFEIGGISVERVTFLASVGGASAQVQADDEPMGEPNYYAHRIERSLDDFPHEENIALHRGFLADTAKTIRRLIRGSTRGASNG